MVGQVDDFMRATDAFSWYMETDPALRSTIVAVAWLDQSPDWDVLVDRLERATRLVPIFRQRPVEPPGRLATPRWSFDPDFDLCRHLCRVGSPPPHTRETVLELARQAAMASFDAAHPLWNFTLVEHPTGGEAALVMKLHHSLTDGVGGMQLLLSLFDTEKVPPRQGALPEPPDESALGGTELVAASILHSGRKLIAEVRHQAITALPALGHAGLHPLRTARDAFETWRSVGRTIAPVATTLSPIMKGRSLGRRLAMLEVGLHELKAASAAAGGSVNDGFMAGVTGGLRRYHEHHGQPVDELRVTLPISIRTAGDPVGGNRITLERFMVPVSLTDPAERITVIARRCRAARDERSLPHSNAIAGALSLLPSGAIGSMLKHVDFLASNVPGLDFPVYLAGARMTRFVPFSPTLGSAVNVTLLSYDGVCAIGVTVDTAAVPDIDVFMTCLDAGFSEVLSVGPKEQTASPRVPSAADR